MPIFEPRTGLYVPTFQMIVGNFPLEPAIAKTILEVSVTQTVDPPNQFSFQMSAPNLALIDPEKGRLTEGSRVEISLGFVGNMKKMITGEISSLSADFPESGPATLQVEGFDLLHRLTRGVVYRKFEGPTTNSGLPDSEIAAQIAGEMRLNPSVTPTSPRKEPRVQDNISNLNFLKQIAEENNYFLWVEDDTLYFTSERPSADNIISLKRGKTLLSFSARLSTANQVLAVEVRRWDAGQKQSLVGRVERSPANLALLAPAGREQIALGAGEQSTLVVKQGSGTSATETSASAEAMMRQQEESLLTGSGASLGMPDMRVGTILELTGIGRFNGNYVVDQVTHSVGGSGYQTSFQGKRQT